MSDSYAWHLRHCHLLKFSLVVIMIVVFALSFVFFSRILRKSKIKCHNKTIEKMQKHESNL